ncbi:MAG: hypothetical protein LUD78_11685 [Clostridiales bacterium]|nr:hypothetical protein [Clostridiales bacterium]
MSNIRVTLCNADAVLFPASGRKGKVVITLSGSEGGLEHAEKLARYLQSMGVPAFALGYFGTKHSARYLSRVGLENIEEAIRWLTAQGYEKIGIEGVSKGAEYAAAAAIQFSELSMVILKTPSWFYSEGMTAGKRPFGTSCWSYQGRELPFTPYKTRRFPIAREILRHREFNILEFNTGKAINPESIIPVEKIKAPILLFSTKADTIWPSAESGQKIAERLEEHDFPYPYQHICFDHMSHMMLENCGSAIRWFIKSEKQFPEECAKERIIMGEECVRWIEQVWK